MHRKKMNENESNYAEESSIRHGKDLDGSESIIDSSIVFSSNNLPSSNIDRQHSSNSKIEDSENEVNNEKERTIKGSKSHNEEKEVANAEEADVKFKNVKKKEGFISSNNLNKPSSNNSSDKKIVKEIDKDKFQANLNSNGDNRHDINVLFPNEELHKITTPFTLDIIKLADECFDIYQVNVQNRNGGLIDINEVQNLLDVLGIKKNIFEIKNSIIDLKKSKKFPPFDQYSKENFLDIVDFFRNYRIDDKLLVEAYRSIDDQCDGFMSFEDLKKISLEKKLNFSDEEINDILYFFELDDIVKCDVQNKPYVPEPTNFFNFEKFCKLFYQG